MRYQIVRVSKDGKVAVVGEIGANDADGLLAWLRANNPTAPRLLAHLRLPVFVCADGTRYYVR